MTLKDISNGPEWVMWVVFVLFVIISVVLLTGHGVNLIAGYNNASKEEKEKINTKKLCRVVGCGMLFIALLILVAAVGQSVIPASFVKVFVGLIFIDCVVIIVLANTICKK